MLYNATILSIAMPMDATPGGDPQWGVAASTCLRCCLSDPIFSQRQTIQQLNLDATNIVYVLESEVRQASITVVDQMQMSIMSDGDSAALTFIVRKRGRIVNSGADSHEQLFMRQL